MVDLKVVDDEGEEEDDDNIKLLQKPTENRLVSTLTSSKFTISIELIKVILLFVICIVVGLSLAVRKRTITTTTTHVEDAQVVPLGDPTLPTELRGNSTEPPAPTDWEYKLVLWDSTYVEDCQATSSQWENLKKSDGGTGSSASGNGPYCYCGDSPCNAEFGPDVINSDQPYNPDLNPEDSGSNLWYKVNRFGLVPPETPCNKCGRYPNGQYGWNFFESKSSFVNNALKEGLTRDELFTECYYPTSTRIIKYWRSYYIGEGAMKWYDLTDEQYGGSHYGFTPVEFTVGESLSC